MKSLNDYTHEKLTDHLYRITDHTGVCCYLAIGHNKAALLDTCNGLGDIRSYVESLTSLPVIVILTHGHLDHMGGAAIFKEIHMNHKDLPVFNKHGDMTFRVSDTNGMLHEQLTASDFIPTYEGDFIDIKNEEVFNLGDLHIKMIPVPGHTPGMMCPLIMEDRIIIFGDACGVGVLLFDEFSSNVSSYKGSLIYLKTFEHDYDTIYRNHGTFTSPKELLDNVITCCEDILTHKDDHVPVEFHGSHLFAAKKMNGHQRVDGKEGNIMYSLDKAN